MKKTKIVKLLNAPARSLVEEKTSIQSLKFPAMCNYDVPMSFLVEEKKSIKSLKFPTMCNYEMN